MSHNESFEQTPDHARSIISSSRPALLNSVLGPILASSGKNAQVADTAFNGEVWIAAIKIPDRVVWNVIAISKESVRCAVPFWRTSQFVTSIEYVDDFLDRM
jgi:hypothetical protein